MKIAKKIATKAPLAVKAALTAVKYGLETDLETGLRYRPRLARPFPRKLVPKRGVEASRRCNLWQRLDCCQGLT